MLDIKLGHNVLTCLHQELVHLLHPSHNKVDILKLCSNKIAWGTYALLQMILEYFPAFGRSLHCVKISKKPSFFVGIRTCQKRAAILDFECW